jgi:hypothetical protein
MEAAYAGATTFLRFTPGMEMKTLPNVFSIGPVSAYADAPAPSSRAEVARRLALPLDKRWLLVALGGIVHRLPVEDWPEIPGTQLLVPADWQVAARADVTPYSDAQIAFADLLPSVDIVLSKPGYGTFVEAACCGLPLLYLRREDWPEAECLETWLHAHARATVLPPEAGASGTLGPTLEALLAQPAPPRPAATGIRQALRLINERLDGGDRINA